jgi:outer membrane receptor protein involved in Fe transport
LDGKFSISIPDGNGSLVFSFIGFTTQEVAVNQRTSINVTLATANTALNEVVVTALGIKRQSKSLGYATTNVAAEELTVNRTTNFMNALQGKVAGVNITPMGTGPAGTSKIRIRGQSSFGGNNSPLIVVNGVPIDNTNYAARGDVAQRGSNRTSDGGDGLGSINPDDIESMSVLKGAAASAFSAGDLTPASAFFKPFESSAEESADFFSCAGDWSLDNSDGDSSGSAPNFFLDQRFKKPAISSPHLLVCVRP